MVITKDLKRIAKLADYFFIHVDNYKATIELMQSKDAKGDYNPSHVATYDDIICEFKDYSRDYYNYNGKARIYVDKYEADSFLSLLQILHIDTEIQLEIIAGNNSKSVSDAYLVKDDIFLTAYKNNKQIGKFLIYTQTCKDNLARGIQYI